MFTAVAIAAIAYVALDAAASVYVVRKFGVYATRARVRALVIGK